MKLFDWMHRKSRQTPAHGIGQLCAGSFCEEDGKRRDWYPNGRDDRSSSTMKPATASVKPIQVTLLEQCFLEIQTSYAGQSDLTELFGDIQNRLLAIGTFGMSSLEDEEEMTDSGEMKRFGGDSEVSAMEVQELQNELEKVFYTNIDDGHSKVESLHAKTLGSKNEKDSPQQNEAEEYNDDTSEQKVQTEKTLFPLQEFLETPVEPATLGKKKKTKKSKASYSLGHFLSWEKNADQRKRIDARVTDSPKRISTSPLALFKSKRAPEQGELQSKSKLHKFLHIFRKRNTRQRSPDPGVIDDQEDGSRGSIDSSLPDLNYGVARVDALGDHEEEAMEELEAFNFEDSCWFRSDDLWMLKSVNESWIKTDDEYVVLEL